MSKNRLSFTLLIKSLKASNHLDAVLDDIQPNDMLKLLSKAGLRDALAMQEKSSRRRWYIETHQHDLIVQLDREMPAEDTILAWVGSRLTDQISDVQTEVAPEASGPWLLAMQAAQLIEKWTSTEIHWKVALITGAVHLLRPDLVPLNDAQVDKLLRRFDDGSPELVDHVLAHLWVEATEGQVQAELARLLDESEGMSAHLAALAERLGAGGALPSSEEMRTVTIALQELRDLFSRLQVGLEEQAADVTLSDGVELPSECETVAELTETAKQILEARTELNKQRREGAIREEVVSALRPVLSLTRADGQEMSELGSIKKDAQALIEAVKTFPLDQETCQQVESVRAGSHPLLMLLRVVLGEITGDDELLSAHEIIDATFGRKLALLALSNRLRVMGPETEGEPAEDICPTTEESEVSPADTQPDKPEAADVAKTESDKIEATPASKIEPEEKETDESPVESTEPRQAVAEESVEVAPKVDVVVEEDVAAQTKGVTVSESKSRTTGTAEIEESSAIIRDTELSEEWHGLLWGFVRDDDVPGAYWLTRSWEVQDILSPIPSWLLAAIQGAQWLARPRGEIAHDLTKIVYQRASLSADLASQVLGVSAALVPSLVAPSTGTVAWLGQRDLQDLSGFDLLAKAVQSYADRGYPLRQEDLAGVTGQADLTATLDEKVEKAEEWIRNAPSRGFPFKRAADVWRYWVTPPEGQLWQILSWVSEDERSTVADVRTYIEDWRGDPIADRMHRDDVRLHGRHVSPIVGAARNKLIKDAESALWLAEEWCDLVERQREIESRGNWFFEQVQMLRKNVKASLPEARKDLRKLEVNEEEALVAGSHVARRAIGRLCELLDLPDWDVFRVASASKGQYLGTKGDLTSRLAYRLLLLPDATLDDDGQPTSEDWEQLSSWLMDTNGEERTVRDAFESRLGRQDYRFGSVLLPALSNEPDSTDLTRRWDEAQSGSQAILEDEIQHTTDTIEQALVDGIITAEEKSQYDAEVEVVRADENRQNGCNYAPLYQRLEAVRYKLQQARAARLKQQQARWKKIRGRLETGVLDAELRGRIIQFMETALDRKDTVVVDERLASLEESLDRGQVPGISLFSPPKEERDVYKEFLKSLPRLQELLERRRWSEVVGAVEANSRMDGLDLPRLPKPRLEATVKAMRAWRQLKHLDRPSRPDIRSQLADILSYLDFSFVGYPPKKVEERQRGKDWVYLRVDMSASDLSPVPQFGSLQDGHFNVVCLWERPGMDTIGAKLHDLNLLNENVLVLYFARLLERQRLDLLRFARERRVGMAVLDEILLVFLAREYRSRLPVFLQCALPLAFVNPYEPTGIVLPEMLFGRDDMIRSLQSPTGAAFVYGGRQLGKSALLRRVEREFHRPEREQYALYEDIKLVGDPTSSEQYDEAIWLRLRDGLSKLGLLETRAYKPETILRKIYEVVDASGDRRVLILLDEADRFLKADENKNFAVVSKLKRVMDDTDRRFKAVFAGLHDVQRFQNIPNQPLAHLDSLQVGPLEPRASQELIHQPMESLGFCFADERAVLRILAYTNYHPGLIQLFCRELIKHLCRRDVNELAPYPIEQSDIEVVYRRDQVRDEIRKRFSWTLALDQRYRAITLALVFDQMEDRDGYAKAYSVAEILEQGQGWWPKGFRGLARDQLQGILGEMCGLGVLVRNARDHRYRLRSPNLVRLMGSEEDIENSLLEISEREPEIETIIPHSHRAPLDDRARQYSCFTHAQADALHDSKFGVGLIFGSEALGLGTVRAATQQFVPEEWTNDGTGAWTEMRFASNSGGAMDQSLSRFLERHSDHQQLIACRFMRGSSHQLVEQVRAALHFCRRHESSRRQWMRVYLVFNPVTMWEWLQVQTDDRAAVEEQADAVVWLCRWDVNGLKQRLNQHGKMSSSEDCKELLVKTGGWPWLLDQVSDRWTPGNDDPFEGVTPVWEELEDDESRLRTQFVSKLGIEGVRLAHRVLEVIIDQGPGVPIELLTPDLVAGVPVPSADDCRAARDYLIGMDLVQVHNRECTAEPAVERLLSPSKSP
jgi:hypothetical protein